MDKCECSGAMESSVLTVKEKRRSLASPNVSAGTAKNGNGRKEPKKDDQAASKNHRSQGGFAKLSEECVAVADNMFVKMPLAKMSTQRNKQKRKKGHSRPEVDLPNEDEGVSRKREPDTALCHKKMKKKKNDAQTQVKNIPNKGLIGLGLSEDLRPDITALPNNDLKSLTICSRRSTEGTCTVQKYSQCGIIRGKRFSKEEDELIKDAVSWYIERNMLGKEGFRMLINRRKYPHVKQGCWKDIATSIPWRLPIAVKQRAMKLFLNDIGHKWTLEEIKFVQEYVSEHGKRWTAIADHLGVSSMQVYRAWSRYRNPNCLLGTWSQDECQRLFDLVHTDLRKTAFIEKNDRCGMAKENVSWTAISDVMPTRHMFSMSKKWYRSLSSSMVAQGLWSDVDDYHLVDKLLKLDAYCVEDVDWDNLLSNRPGAICQKRWLEMTRHIGGNVERSFMEQVELLSSRYRIDMLEYRERALMKIS